MVLIERTVSVGSGGGSLQADNTDIRTSRDSTLNLCVGHDISMILVLFLVVRGSRQFGDLIMVDSLAGYCEREYEEIL